jgi:hypothetical protein
MQHMVLCVLVLKRRRGEKMLNHCFRTISLIILFAAISVAVIGVSGTLKRVDGDSTRTQDLDVSSSLTGISYLANEGCLIEVDGKKVLIDALFRQGVEGYAVLSTANRQKLESGRETQSGRRLRSDQWPDSHRIAKRGRADHAHAPRRQPPDAQHPSRAQPAGSEPRLYRRDRREEVPAHRRFRSRGLRLQELRYRESGIDVAFIPYWYFFDAGWKRAVRDQIQAKQVVLMHIPPRIDQFDSQVRKMGGWKKVWAGIKAEFPNAVYFEK